METTRPVAVAADAATEIEKERAEIRAQARAALGIEGTGKGDAPPLRKTLKRTGVGWYPLVALGVLAIIDQFQSNAFIVLGPDVARSLGMSKGALGAAVALKLGAISLAALPMAAYVQNHPRRAQVSIVTAFAWSAVTLSTGFIAGFAGLLAVLLLDGASTGSVTAVHQPLLMDSYPPQARVRSFSYYQGANYLGNVIAPLLIAALTGWLAYTWRGVFLVMGVVSLAGAFFALRLRDPGFGHWDTGRVRDLVQGGKVSDERSQLEERTKLRFFEILRRILIIPTQRKILFAFGVLGVMIVPFNTFFFFFRTNAGASALKNAPCSMHTSPQWPSWCWSLSPSAARTCSGRIRLASFGPPL